LNSVTCAAVAAFGSLHILFNNAGRICSGTVETTSEPDGEAVVHVIVERDVLRVQVRRASDQG
jgi:NAD(P)-dependent dehydrogenase (short-subunit alcohol dehydrogenase family)